MLQASKCGLMLQSPRGLASEPGKEVLAAEPQEDDSGGRRLPCLSGASETSSLLVKEALAMCSLPLLTFEGGALLNKTLSCASGLLAGGLLLASTSGVLVEEPLAISDAFGVNLVEEPLANHTFEWGNVQPQTS
jgi:hypothetical protein